MSPRLYSASRTPFTRIARHNRRAAWPGTESAPKPNRRPAENRAAVAPPTLEATEEAAERPQPCFASARDGDPIATLDVVEALRPRIARMSSFYARRTGEDPDDLLQEAWLGVLESLPALDLAIGQPDQYLLQRARWRVLDTIKRARVRRCLPLEESFAETMPARDTYPIAAACVSEFAGSLKEAQRAVLGCLMEGLTWREAGSVLGCTSANVAYHVRQIRRRYEEWSDEPCDGR
jgi:RNA polymerase sigma-70 factor (ECF subfamily)